MGLFFIDGIMKITNFIACVLLPITILSNYCYSANDSRFSAGRTFDRNALDEYIQNKYPYPIICYTTPSKQCNSELKVRKELLNPNSELIKLNVENKFRLNDNLNKELSKNIPHYDELQNSELIKLNMENKFRLNDNLNKELSKNIPHYDELQIGVVKYENQYYLAFYEKDMEYKIDDKWNKKCHKNERYVWYYIDADNDLGLLGYTPLF